MVTGNVVTKTKVRAFVPTRLDQGSEIRIEPIDAEAFAEGTQIVVGGVHYLNDGDEVNVVDTIGAEGGDVQ